MSGVRASRRHSPPAAEIVLAGGTANHGLVVRVGDTVRRPRRGWSPATHALLHHLEAVGFDGAPRYLGVDAQGREVLSYLPGTAVVPPYPDWALTDQALVSVAELLRDYHQAASTFDPTPYVWAPSPPERFVGGLVTHNDPNLDNVIFREGRAVALIDFDLAGPGSRAWEVACAARLWAPLRPDTFVSDNRRGRALRRLRLFVDSYGMDEPDRLRVLEAVPRNYRWFYDLIKRSVRGGHAAFARYWTSTMREQAEPTMAWFADNEPAMRAALGL
jgi:Phosphotransferase enzyme family